MTYTPTPEMLQRVDRLDSYGGIVRGKWQGRDDHGREIACWLGALDPAINSVTACPADVMPHWLAHLIPLFDDYTSEAAWPGLLARFRALLRRWHVLDAAAWRRCDLRTRDAILVIAEPLDTAGVVARVRALIARELMGDPPTSDEWRWAANAAEAAEAAEAEAAEAAARWALSLAAEAEAAAWDSIADACFSAIEAECDVAFAQGEGG